MTAPLGTTGQGTSVTLDGVSSCVRSVQLPTWTMEMIDAPCLDDTGFMKKIPADLIDGGSVSVTSTFGTDGTMATPSDTQITISVVMPGVDGAAGATLSGTGCISECTGPSAEIGTLMEQTVTFTFDGEVGPTFT